MGSLLDRLRQSGSLHAEGEFTLDLAQADAKLARFQFREEHEFLYHLVAGLYRVGATAVEVRHATGVLTISIDMSLPDDIPAELSQHVLVEFSPWRRLAAACQAALAHDPGRFEFVGAAKEQIYDYLHQQGKRWKNVRLREIRLVDLATPLVERALEELQTRAAYNRRKLTVNGRVLPSCIETLTAIAGQRGFFKFQPTATHATLELVVDGMLTAPKAPELGFPWWGVVYWEPAEVRLDASLAAVNEDEAYQQLLAGIPQTYAACMSPLLELAAVPGVRILLMGLMRLPMPSWLQPFYPRLCQLPMFTDQNERRWSIEQLQAHPEQIYHSATVFFVELDEVVLYVIEPAILVCLSYHLGERLCEATPRVLKELQRRANQKRWQALPVLPLELPAGNWLVQQKFEDCALGIADDWRQPGGQVTLLHQGKLLVNRTVELEEMSFRVVAEVAEEQISDLWNDVTKEAFESLKAGWLGHLEKMVLQFSEGESPVRVHLLAHLSSLEHPEESYFSGTMLFRDWRGQPYSIDSLRAAKGGNCPVGHVAPECRPDDYPAAFLPRAIYVQAGPLEAACLGRVKDLSLRNFNCLLADLQQCEGAPQPLDQPWAVSWEGDDYRATLQITAEWGIGTIAPVISGKPIALQEVRSEVGFQAQVFNDNFKLQVRTANDPLGPERYTLALHAPWRHCQEELLQHVADSVRLRLQSELTGVWKDWALQAVLRGLASEYPELQTLVSWPAYPEPLTLEQILAEPTIFWRSAPSDISDFLAERPEVEVLVTLPVSQQQTLSVLYGGNWECVDSWFEKSERLRLFLQNQPHPLGAPVVWRQVTASPPLVGMLSLVPAAYHRGSLEWLYKGRLVTTEEVLPPCFLAQVGSEDLRIADDFKSLEPTDRVLAMTELVRQQLTALLLDWLQEPHPDLSHLGNNAWSFWCDLGPEVEAALQRQPWFFTNVGRRSWSELMAVKPLYRLPQRRYDNIEGMTIVFDFLSPVTLLEELMERHPEANGSDATRLFIEDRARFERRQANLRTQAKRMANLPHKVSLRVGGEIALVEDDRKDCWLVKDDRAVRIHNLPSGFTGYLEKAEGRIELLGDKEAAYLAPAVCESVCADLVPLLLTRIEAGRLNAVDTDILAEFCLSALPLDPVEPPWSALWQASWVPCADGTRVSLRQLGLEGQEQGRLCYWDRRYALAGVPTLTPLLTTPLMVEVVQRFTGVPCELTKPLLYQDVATLAMRNLRSALEGLGRWAKSRPGSGVLTSMRQMLSRRPGVEPATGPDGDGLTLLAALRRQASQMLHGPAREETLRTLDRASWRNDGRGRLWTLRDDGHLFLHATHPSLAPFLGDVEPPPPVTLSLLLGLVSLINARSLPFSDDMEREFLESMTLSLVETYRDVISPG